MSRKIIARLLRRRSPDAERHLWHHLRDRRLAGYRFRRQEPIGPYFADFVCLDTRLIVEADGGQHSDASKRDDERTRYLESLGYRVVRFWNHEILGHTDAVLEQIHKHLINSPHPRPLPGGESETS